MTFRLVGLMSLVLLLSLAAFAYLMNSYQAGVMQEVNRTVSAVGKATLQSFEFHVGEAGGKGGSTSTPGTASEGNSGKHAEYSYEVRAITAPGEAEAQRGGTEGISAPELLARPSAGVIKRVIRLQAQGKETVPGSGTPNEAKDVVIVQIDNVRAESDPDHGTVLKIPTWTFEDGRGPASGGTGEETPGVDHGETIVVHGPGEWRSRGEGPLPGGAAGLARGNLSAVGDTGERGSRIRTDAAPAGRTGEMGLAFLAEPATAAGTGPPAWKEIVLPIPTHDFESLFAAYRRRSLYLFLGIFVFGTLLSAGLAARFTRPVRRLDAGIRRLTEGDLNAQVEARGRDEIGRLARGFNEMTRRLRAGQEREQDLRRREKLSALGRLAAGVAHDVRNPLHSIGLTLQNLEETARPGEEGRGREFDRSVGIIREEIRRLDRLVENFLRFARSDRTARMPVDLGRLARETAQLVEKEAQRRCVRIEVVDQGSAGIVEGNMESIRSSVLNLVLNSFEAMPEGGTLTLTLGRAEGEARLEVADTGRGIPAEEQERVFEFAYTTREEGHGMGLAMVHQVVVEEHGGRVSLQSRPGEGTRVLLAFPAGSGPASAGTAVGATRMPGMGGATVDTTDVRS